MQSITEDTSVTRKIIHIDMDCFYAAVEIREQPELANLPVAVGGSPNRRGVLCTCNYLARKYGIHSAMPTSTALRLCPQLVLLPVNMPLYKEVSKKILAIFRQYTMLVEPLALDEAYLDVTDSKDFHGSATLIAESIRKEIWDKEGLTASAGVSVNKFLAKIASSWNKPNGIFVIRPEEIIHFISSLPVKKLFGVGKVTSRKLEQLGIFTCHDLQAYSLNELNYHLGKLGTSLYFQSRGIDNRSVENNRERKSLSIETTFNPDLHSQTEVIKALDELFAGLTKRIESARIDKSKMKSQFVKVKFNNFKLTTSETAAQVLNLEKFYQLLSNCLKADHKPIRLLGVGISFHSSSHNNDISSQPRLF